MKQCKLRMNGRAYEEFRAHLFPGDGKEAVAFALCGRYESSSEEIYLVHRVEMYPYDKCIRREKDRVEWCPPDIVHLMEECRRSPHLSLLKIHSHPGYWPYFSEVDDESDMEVSETLNGWLNRPANMCSVIMLPDGHLFGRVMKPNGHVQNMDSIVVIGDNITRYEWPKPQSPSSNATYDEAYLRTRQAFGEGTVKTLAGLTVGVVGCSGTGSPVIEQLARLGVGKLVLVDPDVVERKNLNRILNTKALDATNLRPKVEVLEEAILQMGLNTQVVTEASILHKHDAYHAIAGCDVVFGCMDGIDGRHLLNRIATYFCIGYIDLGVALEADGEGGIHSITGRVSYVQPGGSSLLTRECYTLAQLQSADLRRTNPQEYEEQLRSKYVVNMDVESPAVISINMAVASHGVNELLARIHPFRDRPNARFANVYISFDGMFIQSDSEGEPDKSLSNKVGLGETTLALDSFLIESNAPQYEAVAK